MDNNTLSCHGRLRITIWLRWLSSSHWAENERLVGNEITRTPADVGRNRFIGFNPSDDDVFGGEKPRTRVIVGAITFFARQRMIST